MSSSSIEYVIVTVGLPFTTVVNAMRLVGMWLDVDIRFRVYAVSDRAYHHPFSAIAFQFQFSLACISRQFGRASTPTLPQTIRGRKARSARRSGDSPAAPLHG
ncbi:MAG: hypothetical protein R3D52_11390 [Xanthobacteraceae bacterium]